MTAVDYCKSCNAPMEWPKYFTRCGACAVVNGKLPPTNYVPIRESSK